jgi:hypothetical protein
MRGTARSVPRTAALALTAAIGGCDGGERVDAVTSERGDAGISVSRTGKGCPRTRPNREPPPPLQASVPAGYGSSGFQATGLTFPTRGCWRVVGSVAGHELELVVFVTKRRAAQM